MVEEDEIVTETKPPQILRERVRREHDAALAPRSAFGDLSMPVDREQLAELLKPETLRRNADSLPVLAAFQEFLDVERRRTRGRMLALTSLFLLILLAAGGATFLVGLTFYRKTQSDTTAMHASLDSIRTQVESQQDGASKGLSDLETRADVLETALDRQMTVFQGEQDELTAQLAGMNTNLSSLHSIIARLQNENAQLHSHLKQNDVNWSAVTNRVEDMLRMLVQAPPAAIPPAEPEEEPPLAVMPEAPPRPLPRKSLVLAIIPEGGGRAFDWRIPLPPIQE